MRPSLGASIWYTAIHLGHIIEQLQQSWRVWSAQARERIPARNSLEAIGTTARVATLFVRSASVEEWRTAETVMTYLG